MSLSVSLCLCVCLSVSLYERSSFSASKLTTPGSVILVRSVPRKTTERLPRDVVTLIFLQYMPALVEETSQAFSFFHHDSRHLSGLVFSLVVTNTSLVWSFPSWWQTLLWSGLFRHGDRHLSGLVFSVMVTNTSLVSSSPSW